MTMRSYWGPATLTVGEESFDIKCALDEGLVPPDAPVRGWYRRARLVWGGYFRLLDPSREGAFHAALSENPTATLHVPDGRQGTVSIHEDRVWSADGTRWLERP